MNESLDFTAYVSYFLIVAYYVIMLRKWLPPPRSGSDETAGDEKPAAGRGGKLNGVALRQVAAPLANDNRESKTPRRHWRRRLKELMRRIITLTKLHSCRVRHGHSNSS